MTISLKFIYLFFTPLLVLGIGCTSPTIKENTTTSKSMGQTRYENNCTACHGTDGSLCVLGAKDLTLSNISKEESLPIITNGKNTMPAFGNMLTSEEVIAVADYIQTLKAK